MEEPIKEYGLMTCKMVVEFKNGEMEAVMKVNLKMEWSMDKGYINGEMVATIKENGKIIS